MSRNNGKFNYKIQGDPVKDPETGFLSGSGVSNEWIPGCECQIEKHIPAKQIVGADGQTCSYTYNLFIPKYFGYDLAVGSQIQVISEDGVVDEFYVSGIDDINRKYIEVWG